MRTFSGPLLAALQAETGERVILIEMNFSGGTVRYSTGAQDLSWNGQTWTAAGGAIAIGTVEESGDMKGSGVDIVLSGVDQTVTGILLAQNYRGRDCNVWVAALDQADGDVIGTIQLFDGLQLEGYEVEEKLARGKPGSITVRTRGRNRLSVAEFRGIRANISRHQEYYSGDTFFQHVASFANRKIFWGTEAPAEPGSSKGGVSIGGRGGSGPAGDERGRDERVY